MSNTMPLWRIAGVSKSGHPFTRKVRAPDYLAAERIAKDLRPCVVLVISLDNGTREQISRMRAVAVASYVTAFERVQ